MVGGISSDAKLTPAMMQYKEVKEKHPDCLVLFRMGDFYETFYEDAINASKALDITLTARGKGDSRAPLAGIPYHALNTYLPKLVSKGFKVAICEQTEDPRTVKGRIVKRAITRIITPGTIIEDCMLDAKSNNYIFSIYQNLNTYALSIIDLSTGEFFVTEVDENQLLNEITRFKPKETLLPESLKVNKYLINILEQNSIFINPYSDHHYTKEHSYNSLLRHFNTINLKGFGLEKESLTINSAGALINYLKETQKTNLDYINKIKQFSPNDFMILDSSTQRNLELLKNILDNTSKGTLLSTLDKTNTSVGARFLKKIILQPLLSADSINQRLDAVEELKKDIILTQDLTKILNQLNDVERIIAKINYGTANARDLIALKESLQLIPDIKQLLSQTNSETLKQISNIKELKYLLNLINESIKQEPNVSVREGNMIKSGYNKELDELRDITHNSKQWIASLEKEEKQKTGIGSLRIGFNNVFGYYITISKANLDKVPEHYMRKQTLVNAERFITPELKEKESLILNAEEKINDLEYDLFVKVCEDIKQYTKDIQDTSNQIAMLDILLSFAIVAKDNNYVRPLINDNNIIELKDSRHPVVELIENIFVPNDIIINKEQQTLIITGPNMAGKSVFMRQVALIQLMMQLGSFVPCAKANICLVDRIFTRVGAYDDLTHGQSTFMVEMNEAANILNNATERSLVILDEIGRGTSTFDGISLAWSIAEYIHNHLKAKTLFATHYHQMNKLQEKLDGVKNFNIAVKETDDEIIFLRKIVKGGTDKSYGIQVAKLAGLPTEVIERSKQIMNRLEMEDEIAERVHKPLKETKVHQSLPPTTSNEQNNPQTDKPEIIRMHPDETTGIIEPSKKVKQMSLFDL